MDLNKVSLEDLSRVRNYVRSYVEEKFFDDFGFQLSNFEKHIVNQNIDYLLSHFEGNVKDFFRDAGRIKNNKTWKRYMRSFELIKDAYLFSLTFYGIDPLEYYNLVHSSNYELSRHIQIKRERSFHEI